MKQWIKPEVQELNMTSTEHQWTGIYRDGGYIGDGEISGHLSWTKPTQAPTQKPTPTQTPLVNSPS